MYELLWYLFVAIMEGIVTLKKSIVKYIYYYKVDEIISTYRAYVRFQYFAIDFNKIIQDMIQIFKTIGDVLLVLSSGN